MIKVKEILEKKGHGFWSVNPKNTVFEALQTMAEKEIGAVIVLDGDKLVGIFSERDYARKIVLHGLASKNTFVGDFMTKNLVTVNPTTSIYDCMTLMTDKRIRHLPVLEDNRVLGVISIGDVVNTIIHDLNVTIDDLKDYIHGGRYGV